VLLWSLWIHLPQSVVISLWYVMVSIHFNTWVVSDKISWAHLCLYVIWMRYLMKAWALYVFHLCSLYWNNSQALKCLKPKSE
jgi:hypothetical protein